MMADPFRSVGRGLAGEAAATVPAAGRAATGALGRAVPPSARATPQARWPAPERGDLGGARLRGPADHRPVIILSGDSNPVTVNGLLAAGAADFPVKPFDIHELLAIIGRYLH